MYNIMHLAFYLINAEFAENAEIIIIIYDTTYYLMGMKYETN
jgi:hypothetical protein